MTWTRLTTIAGHKTYDAGNEAHGAEGRDLDGWMDSWIYLFTPPTGRVGVQGVFCICFRIELITGTHETSRRNCVGVQVETLDPVAVA